MSDARIAAALMADARISALVGARVALAQLPQGTALPALVYQIISANAQPYLADWKEPGLVTFRLQVNPLAKTAGEVNALHDAVLAVCRQLHGQSVAGQHLTHVERAGLGSYDKDNDSGTWTRSADYLITYESD